jgi:hypothetical protein
VQDAIRRATRTGANEAVATGQAPVRNPFQFDANGNMSLRQQRDGSQAIPNLQFWDIVQRELRDMTEGSRGPFGRDTNESRILGSVRNRLVSALDQRVPEFQSARQGAARAFGADDALEAGRKFVHDRRKNAQVRQAVARMTPAERELFAEGFASELTRSIREVRSSRDVLNSIFAGDAPAARERIMLALGRNRGRQMEAFLNVEAVLNDLRTAVQGNSSTARQLLTAAGIGAGLGGGGSFYMSGDLSGAQWGGLLLAGAKFGKIRLNQRVARRVGEMLASPDPEVFRRGLDALGRNRALLEALQHAHAPLARAGIMSPDYEQGGGDGNPNVPR